MLIEINDITAPELDVFARLTEAQLRSRLEPEKGVFIAESPKVITTAVENGYQPLSFLMERRHAAGDAAALLAKVPAGSGAPLPSTMRSSSWGETGVPWVVKIFSRESSCWVVQTSPSAVPKTWMSTLPNSSTVRSASATGSMAPPT